jgi:predicted HAD superfamily Cof-like phosphohydrolase
MSKTPHQERIERFMMLAGQEVPASPVMPDPKIRKLRARLILEEALETLKGLGYQPVLKPWSKEWDVQEAYEPNLVEVADGCADLSVVTIGTLSACGVSDEGLLRLVDENNLAKFGRGSYQREDGKWVKPPGHQPPDIAGLLGLKARYL